jgi:hypothetical protein
MLRPSYWSHRPNCRLRKAFRNDWDDASAHGGCVSNFLTQSLRGPNNRRFLFSR